MVHEFSLDAQQFSTANDRKTQLSFKSLYSPCVHVVTPVVWGRERLVGEREGAARAWESSLRSEQAAARQALSEAGARVKLSEVREASLKEAEEVRKKRGRCCWYYAFDRKRRAISQRIV